MHVGLSRVDELCRLSRVHAARWLLALLFALLSAGHGGPVVAQGHAAAGVDQAGAYDLQRDERLGGHTLARHVGRTDQELSERLRREPQISAASTYADVTTARRTVARALEESRQRVNQWASRQGSRPNLVLNYIERADGPIGRSLARGERVAQPCDRALVVLRWLERDRHWIVLTSYPEARR